MAEDVSPPIVPTPTPAPIPEEKLPIYETLEVLQSTTIYKTRQWWCAVVLAKNLKSNRTQILIYLWIWDAKKDGWKRKQKLTVSGKKNWDDIQAAVEKYLTVTG